jgi:hypothetical protein
MSYVRNYMPDALPFLPTYGEASLWFDAVKPFSKGRKKGEKPLGRNRRYDRVVIERNDTLPTKPVLITHYNTIIAKYHNDGTMQFQTGGYDSVSTTQILQEVLGQEKFTRQRCKAYFKDTNGKCYRITNGLTVNADSVVDTSNLKPESVRVVNRDKFKAIKAGYKPFMDYAKQVNALTKGGIAWASDLCVKGEHVYYARSSDQILTTDTNRIGWRKDDQIELRIKFFEKVRLAMLQQTEAERMEAMYPLVEFLSFSAAVSCAVAASRGTDDERQYKWETDNKRLQSFFNELLKFHHAHDVFEDTEVPLGTIRHDSNAKYFKFATPTI